MPVSEDLLYTETTYCDERVKKEVFEPSRYGKIRARDHFFDLREEARRNMTVFAKFPHIIKVIYVSPDLPGNEKVIEEYPCEHTEKQKEEVT